MALLEIKNLQMAFNDVEVLKGIDLNVEKGEVVTIIGPSGGGKSTILRCINLLEEPTGGDIIYNGQSILSKGCNRNKLRTRISMVFQQFNLFNNKNVLDNVIIGQTKVLKRDKEEAKKIAIDKLTRFGLQDHIYKNVNTLSGGQKQRVAIARSMCMNPDIILFDEPTSALDPQMVNEVLEAIKTVAKENITMIIVTHEMNFAKNISDRVVFISDGKIEEEGKPSCIFNNPQSELLKQFMNV